MPQEEEAVQTITISGVSEELIEQIDKLAAKEDRTRSSFVRRVLEQAIEDIIKKPKLVGASR